ncbi:MAG: hypothetical protein WC755_01950 [Candidatus Woesearchaeota archaeon]|jgi:hypothetical protein
MELQEYKVVITVDGKEVTQCTKTLPKGKAGELLKAVQDAANAIQDANGIDPDIGPQG